MKSPQRLRDDPEVPSDLQDALDLERDLVDDYDLVGLRGKVVGGPTPTPTKPLFRWSAVIGTSTLTAALVTWALQPDPALPPPPVDSPFIEAVRTDVQRLPHRTIARADDVHDALAAVADSATPPAIPPPAEPPEPAPADPRVPAGMPSNPTASAPAPVVPPAPGGLKAELLAYNLGLGASERGNWATARQAYSAYLQTWPSGRLRTEARLGLLTATVESSSPATVEALASDLLRHGALGSRRKDVQLVRAEALVQLGNCEEAMSIVHDFRRESRANSVRQTCKRVRRSE